MFFSAFRVEGIWKRAAAVCDARHLLAEFGKMVCDGRCGRDERRRSIKRADVEATSRFHVLTTLQRNPFGSTQDSCCAFGVQTEFAFD
jgi:hypothetical protein